MFYSLYNFYYLERKHKKIYSSNINHKCDLCIQIVLCVSADRIHYLPERAKVLFCNSSRINDLIK